MNALLRMDAEKIRYLLVGGWNTLVGYCVFLVLYLWLSERLHYIAIAIISHFLSVLNAWIGYRRLVFRSRSARLAEYLRFNATSALLLAFQVGSLWLLSGGLGLHPLMAQAIAITVSVVLSYLVHKHVSFRQGHIH